MHIFQKIVLLFYALKNRGLVKIFCSMRPLVASGEKPKAFFPLTEIVF